jgi:hypothetical protein
MIFAIKSLLMTSFERRFQWEVEELMVWASLYVNTTNNLVLSSTRLILQEKSSA